MSTKPIKILITDYVHSLLPDGLRALGFDVDYDTSIDNDKLDYIIKDYNGLIINSKIIMNKARIDKSDKLSFIARLGSGLEIIDIAHARLKGITVYNTPEGNSNAVAEHTFGLMFALLNNIVKADRQLREKNWQREQNRGSEIKGKTIGIIGMGHMGVAFAEKLSPWRLKVLSYDKYRVDYPGFLDFVHITSIEDVIEKSDIISLHLPLTEETKHMVNVKFLNKCKKGVFLINTSRGKVINTSDLIEALKSGQVGGAALDVFENEKPMTYTEAENAMYSELYTMDNVVLTPHIAGWTHESLKLIAEMVLNKIKLHFE